MVIFENTMTSRSRLAISFDEVRFIMQDRFVEFERALQWTYCPECSPIRKTNIIGQVVILNHLNDLVVSGKCSRCEGSVNRYLEIGEDPEYFNRAEALRIVKQAEKSEASAS